MPSSDLQNQRLRHLFASAILELWKKETGSVTSVLIEGTVCVTVHGGRTTVVQLCERFTGLVNGDCERPAMTPDIGSIARRPSDAHVYVSPPRAATPRCATSGKSCQGSRTKDSNNNVRTASRAPGDVDNGLAGNVDTDDDHCSGLGDDDQSSMLVDEDEATQGHSEGLSGLTGSYRQVTGDSRSKLDIDSGALDDSAIHDMSMNRSVNSLRNDSLTESPPRAGPASASNDLLLSSPHDYTAQVRNVIRQRLLNANGSSKQTVGGGGPFLGQPSMNMPAGASSSSTALPLSSPYYRPTPDTTPPALWIKRESPAAAVASEAMATAARRLASQYAAAAAATGQIPMTLMSPPPLAMSVGLPLPGVPLGANLHSLLGLKSTTSPGAPAALVAGSGSPRVAPPPSTTDSKRPGMELSLAANSAETGQASAEQKIYRCNYCNKTFLFKSKYHEHLPVHTSARPFQCHLCTRTYKYKYDLRVHLRTHLGIPTKSTVCPFCAARFATNKFLRQHMRDAHSNNDAAVPGVAPNALALINDVNDDKAVAENAAASENAADEQMKETETSPRPTTMADDDINDSLVDAVAAPSASPPPASAAANHVELEQQEDGEL